VQEGFGIVLLEAMAAARPIVAARAAAIPEVVPHALLVEPDSHEALAEGIAMCYRQSDLRRSMAAAGLVTVQRFDAPHVARQFRSELEQMMRQAHGSTSGMVHGAAAPKQ
jgi:glycosyltransferase involved in cell wall biosynthesis